MSHYGLYIHVIFSTKFRARLLNEDWRPELHKVLGERVKEQKAHLVQAGGIEDHLHLLLRIHPSFAISDTIRDIKANSSSWINHSRLTKGTFHWQTGYAAFSISHSLLDVVQGYIQNQIEHHREKNFREEYLEFLDRHKIPYNPTYVSRKRSELMPKQQALTLWNGILSRMQVADCHCISRGAAELNSRGCNPRKGSR